MNISLFVLKSINKIPWQLSIVLAFLFVYVFSFTPIMTGSDDSQGLLYHLMGRNLSFEFPYAVYQSGWDFILGFLPPVDSLLRIFSIAFTAISTVLMVLAGFYLASCLIGEKKAVQLTTGQVLFALLAMPELFYFGLVFQTASISLCIMVCAHLLVRKILMQADLQKTKAVFLIISTGVLFAIGTTFRWNTAVYILFIFADCITMNEGVRRGLRMYYLGVFGFISILASLVLCQLTLDVVYHIHNPSNPLTIFKAIIISTHYTFTFGTKPAIVPFVARALLTISSLLTPVALLLIILGTVVWRKKTPRFVLLTIAALGSVSFWAISGTPRHIVGAFPFIFMLVIAGSQKVSAWKRPYLTVLFIIAAILPWLIGVKYVKKNTLWGPGFEYRAYTSLSFEGKPALWLDGGSAFGTYLGPRPMGGHAYVLFGEWRKLLKERDHERDEIVKRAVKDTLPILTMAYSHGAVSEHCFAQGYTCVYSSKPGYLMTAADTMPKWKERVLIFRNNHADSLTIICRVWDGDPDERMLSLFADLVPHRALVTGYESTMRYFGFHHQDLTEYNSKISIVVDADKIREYRALKQ
jgi:hypothetical protein